jgi:hypothetical protein
MTKKIFVAFTHEQPNGKIKDYGNVLFAFADDKNYLHFGGSPKKSYLLTPAQAANVMFSKRSVETRFSIIHCIDITKRELKILREEFKKEGFMPYHFFEKLMLDDKYFPDATVVLKQEPEAVEVEAQNKPIKANQTVARGYNAYCLRRLTDRGTSIFYFSNDSSTMPKLYRTFDDADFAAYELNLRDGSGDWEAIEY